MRSVRNVWRRCLNWWVKVLESNRRPTYSTHQEFETWPQGVRPIREVVRPSTSGPWAGPPYLIWRNGNVPSDFPRGTWRYEQVTSSILSERCTALLDSVWVRCRVSDFDEKLSDTYDPEGKIIVVRDGVEVEEERWAEARRQEEERQADEQSNQFREQPAPGWTKKLGGLANKVGHALDGKRPVGVPGPVGRLNGVWAP